MKPLPLEIPLPSIQIGDKRMRGIAKIFAEIITKDTAELLDRLAEHTNTASDCIMDHGCPINIYQDDEESAYTLAAKIRELLNG